MGAEPLSPLRRAAPLALAALLAACGKPTPPPVAAEPDTRSIYNSRVPSHAARHHYLRALLLAEAGDLDAAEAAMGVARRFDPGSPWPALGFGRHLARLGAYERAIPWLDEAARAKTGGAGWAALAEVYWILDRKDEGRAAVGAWAASPEPELLAERAYWRALYGDAPGAVQDRAAALMAAPGLDAADALIETGWENWQMRSALEALQAAAEAHPERLFLWKRLAEFAGIVDHDPIAWRAAEQWRARGGGIDALAEQARIALRRGDADAAAELWPQIPPDVVERAGLRAGLLALAGDLDGASAVLDAADARWPDDRGLALRRVQIYADAGQVDAALRALERMGGLSEPTRAQLTAQVLLAADPPALDEGYVFFSESLGAYEGAWADAVEWLLSTGDPEAAATSRGILADLDAPPSWSHVQVALALGEDPLPAVDALLAADPLHPQALARKAEALLAGSPDDAGAMARRALEIAPSETAAMEVLARVHYQGGELEDARRWLQEALEIAPDDPDLRALGAELAP